MSQGETNKNKIEKTADSSSSSRKKKARCSSNPDNGVHQLDKNMEPKESSKNEPRSVAKTIEYYMTKLRSHANRGPEETDEKNVSFVFLYFVVLYPGKRTNICPKTKLVHLE
jgi:hypothetical protein